MEPSSTAEADGMPAAPARGWADLPLAERVRLSQLPPPRVRRSTRLAAKATLRDFGRELGVTPMTILRWEKGKVEPKLDHAIAYRALLDAVTEAVQ